MNSEAAIHLPRRKTHLKPGGRIDRHVVHLFVLSYLASIVLVVGIFLILDMATHLDEYLEVDARGNSAGVLEVVEFYCLQLPFFYLEMSPFVTLIAGVFTTTHLSKANEIVAVLGAGVSSRRLLAPVLLCAAFLAVGMFALREWATETIGLQRDLMHDRLIKHRANPVYDGIWVKSKEGVTVRVTAFEPAGGPRGEPMIRGLSCQVEHEGVLEVYVADSARALEPLGEGRWALEGGHVLRVSAKGEERADARRLEGVTFTPEDVMLFYKATAKPLDLSFSGARRVLARRPEDARVRTALHYHMTFPLAGLVLLLVGLPFLVGQEEGRGVERLAVALLLCVAYFGFDFVTRNLGLQGTLGPIHAGWLAVILFGCLGLVLFSSMRA